MTYVLTALFSLCFTTSTSHLSCFSHHFSHFLSLSLSPSGYLQPDRFPPIQLIPLTTTLPQLLLTSRRKCTTLYNQLNLLCRLPPCWPAMRFAGHTAGLGQIIGAASEQPAVPRWWHRLSGLQRNSEDVWKSTMQWTHDIVVQTTTSNTRGPFTRGTM